MNTQEALFKYCCRIGDNSLILGHRLSEWCGHGPILEEDIAMINIALDQLGQAKTILAYAGEVEGKGRNEDSLAFLRTEREFSNAILTEQPNGHFGTTIARQFFMDVFNYYFYHDLHFSKNETLAAFAEKSLKEVTYHMRHTSEWIIRLGDGTEESHEKIQEAIDDLWMFTGELFKMDEVDEILIAEGIAIDLNKIKEQWSAKVREILTEATLSIPDENMWMQEGGKQGSHSEYLGFLLAEMQSMQRTYPNMEW